MISEWMVSESLYVPVPQSRRCFHAGVRIILRMDAVFRVIGSGSVSERGTLLSGFATLQVVVQQRLAFQGGLLFPNRVSLHMALVRETGYMQNR